MASTLYATQFPLGVLLIIIPCALGIECQNYISGAITMTGPYCLKSSNQALLQRHRQHPLILLNFLSWCWVRRWQAGYDA